MGASVTARYSVNPTAWNSVISVAVANVGGTLSGSSTPPGGYGTGYGGQGYYGSATQYGTGGGGGSSVKLGVRDLALAIDARLQKITFNQVFFVF